MSKIKVDQFAFKVGLGLFIVALVVRLLGIDWGLPNEKRFHSLHPDEEIVFLYSQQVEPAKLKFTPGFYNYGTLFLTVCRITSDVVQAYTGGLNETGSNRPEVTGRVIKGCRIVSALAGSALAWLGFLFLYRRTHNIGAIAAGASLALAPALVIHSRFMTVDVLATCLAAASLYWTTRLFPYDDEPVPVLKYALLAGLFAGLSAGTKYTGIIAVLPLLIALAVRHKAEPQTLIKYAAAGTATAVVAFLITTPGILLQPDLFWKDFKFEITHTQQGHGLVFAAMPPGWIQQFSHLLTGFGILAALLAVAGLLWAGKNKALYLAGPVAFLLVQYILLGRSNVMFLRYTFPLMPVLAMGFGYLVGECHQSASKWGRAVVAFAIMALGGIGGGMVSVITSTGWMAEPDPQAKAAEAIRAASISTLGLVSDPWFYTPTLYPQANAGPFMGEKYRFEAAMNQQNPRILRYLPENPKERFDWDTRLLTELKPDMVAYSSYETEGLFRMVESNQIPDEFKLQVDRYKEFTLQLQKDYDFYSAIGAQPLANGQLGIHPYQKVHDLAYIRPIIYLWKRKSGLPTTSTGTSTTSGLSEEPASTP